MVGDCGCGVGGDCNCVSAGVWMIHTGAKSGCKLLTLFDIYCDDGVSANRWVIHTGAKPGCKLLTFFGSDCDDGVGAGKWVIHTYRCHIWR